MKKIIFSSVLFLGLSAFAEEATAPETKPDVDARQERQADRIQKGVESGQITEHEQKHLEKQQHRIEKAEAHAMKDGNISDKEAHRLNRMQNKASRDIRRARHNNKTGH